ncbi:hypothetical protein, conserved [Eimeria praecox]|uniref:Uncharacterized protein n=1 Tax=Eimeria praecox TaxID=51316 RepID=U6GNK2_9EIME|nr:hypothetical protein, conserved [Eimeria praecox]
MAADYGSSPFLVSPCVHLKDLYGLPEIGNKVPSTRAAGHLGQQHAAGTTEEVCRGFDGTCASPKGPYKKRHFAVAGPRHCLPAAAATQTEVLFRRSSPPVCSLTVKPNGMVKGSVVIALALTCFVRLASCVRHLGGDQLEWPDGAQLHSTPTEDLQAEAFSLMRHQVAQLARQKVLEAEAEPSLSSPQNSITKSLVMLQLDGAETTAAEVPSARLLTNSNNLGAILVGEAEGGGAVRVPVQSDLGMYGGSMTAESAPYSFLNWGQIGGMMQNPALAHTGMPVYMPRQVVGTTVGLDFDSPATFHGPLLVLLMVCAFIFFVLLLLCCWMVKSKQKHEKFMAEKIPR